MFSKFTALRINCKKNCFNVSSVHFWSLVLEMTSPLDVRHKQRAVIEFLVSEGESPKQIFERLVKVYGDASIAYSTVKKWVSSIKDEKMIQVWVASRTDEEKEVHLQQSSLETVMRLRNQLEMIAESLLMTLLIVLELAMEVLWILLMI